METYLTPLINSILSWAVVGTLGWTVVKLTSITKAYGLSQSAIKALLRRDLINRWLDVKENHHNMTDTEKSEWLEDYAIYSKLNGKNGYLDNAHEKILKLEAHTE